MTIVPFPPLTNEQMCQAILDHPRCPPRLKQQYRTARALWEYSPRGELASLYELYLTVCRPTIPTPTRPVLGAIRGPIEDRYQVWNGKEWV